MTGVQTCALPISLANSRLIDSDGDGLPNFFDVGGAFTIAPLNLQITGNGTVSPNFNGAPLIVGQSYTLLAQPLDGSDFEGWSGGIASQASQLVFTMTTNLALKATFTYSPAAASYSGLFYEASGVELLKSGYVNVDVTTKGSYSGVLTIGNKKYSFKGQMSASGAATNVIARSSLPTLTARLQFGDNHITGTVGDGTWTADVAGGRAAFSKATPASFSGKYTIAIPGSGSSTNTSQPFGDGYGAVTVNTAGKIKFKGALADGTKLSQSASANSEKQWPFFASLYGGTGQILGWLTFASVDVQDLGGSLSWVKLPSAAAAYYSGGFDVQSYARGSSYDGGRQPITGFQSGRLQLSGGGLAQSLENGVTISAGNKVGNLGPNKLTLTLNPSQGTYSATMTDPNTGKALRANGVMLQKQGIGTGYFLGTSESGRSLLAP